MAVTAALAREKLAPTQIETTARVHLETQPAPTIVKIELVTRATVPGLDAAKFQEIAQSAKANCPISKALAAVAEVTLDAALI